MAHLGAGGRISFKRRVDLTLPLVEDDTRRGSDQWLPPKTGLMTGDQAAISGQSFYLHVDELGYHSLHQTLQEAFAGDPATRTCLAELVSGQRSVLRASITDLFSCELADWTLYMGKSSFDAAEVEEKFGTAISSLACAALVCNFVFQLGDDQLQPDWRIYQAFEMTGRRSETIECFLRLCDGESAESTFGYQGQGLLAEVAINSRQPRQLAGTAELVFIDEPCLAFIQL
jgi:hypothetical protein